jgi:hypothetical protein
MWILGGTTPKEERFDPGYGLKNHRSSQGLTLVYIWAIILKVRRKIKASQSKSLASGAFEAAGLWVLLFLCGD